MQQFEDWVGQHFIIGLQPTTTLSDKDRALLGTLKPAGVILYKSNFDHDAPYESWLATLKTLLTDVRETIGRERLIVAIDHEGARVCRTPPPITRFNYPARWADEANAVGGAMGRELASLGMNLNFAPLLDVASNPDNPVIGERAFSNDPEKVAEAALAFMAGLEAQGVIACGKHFPGHGDTNLDSHLALPELDLSLEALNTRELIPFRKAVAGGIKTIMSSHIMFPQIDPNWPATLSAPIIKGLLRDELGFEGVIMSDDIGMRAMDHFFDDAEAAVRFLQAGNDMLMVCAHLTDTNRALKFAEAIVTARASGSLDPTLLDAASQRVDQLLVNLPQHDVTALPDAVFEQHRKVGTLFGGDTVEVV